MITLSGFDGMSCGRIALDKAGLHVDSYYASEIDKHAVKVSKANYPDILHFGDIENWRDWPVIWASIDLIIAGSPCQGFSFAGKQLAFDDPRSKLFFVWLDILNHVRKVNPDVKFLLENVKMKKEYLNVISETLGVEPMFINSSLVSAQNRQRYYWFNWEVEQPVDEGIMLVDILEQEPFDKTIMSDKFTSRNRTAGCLRDDLSGKAKSLSAMEYVKNGRQGDYIRCGQMVDRDKSYSLTSSYMYGVDEKQYFEQHRKQLVFNSSVTKYRKLTPIECERLQTVPDNYTNHISNTQRYKMLGNGWTVDVIAHILRGLK